MGIVECRIGCSACCVVISISSPLPGFPGGKPPGTRCGALTDDGVCSIWGTGGYPRVCRNFRADPEFCGSSDGEAHRLLVELERLTSG